MHYCLSLICLFALGIGLPSISRAQATKEAAPLTDLRTRKSGSDWPAFLGPTGDSKSTEKGIIKEWPKSGPRIVWQVRIAGGYCAPTTSLGRLFHFMRLADQATLACFNAETGEFLWKFQYPTDFEDPYGYDNGPRCSPIVDEDRVYIFGPEGMLHCVRAVDGELVWKVNATEKFGVEQNFFGVGSTPVVEGNLLITNIGGSKGDSGIVAFDKRTGQVKYQFSDELASYASPKLATIDGRRWCFMFARGGLIGFDPTTGKEDFHFPWRAPIRESVNASNPVVVGNRVFISETYGPGSALLKVRPGGYDEAWTDEKNRRTKSMQTHWNTPIHLDGYVYGSSGRHTANAELRCVELETGKVVWSQPELTRSSLLYVDGHFVCLTEFGDLILVRATPEKYEAISQSVIPGAPDPNRNNEPNGLQYPAWAAPILSHGLLYVRGADRLICLELIPEKK
jgi:outer membrane protein assembly factor BamB